MKDEVNYLIYLAKKAGLYGEVVTSTIKLSKDLDISQQTASRKLILLENKGFIKRTASVRGVNISLSKKGVEELRKVKTILGSLFEARTYIIGRVVSGIGEGKYYVKKYSSKIKNALGFEPFAGTLDVIIDINELRECLQSATPIIISGFETKTRSYGDLTCYEMKINDVDAGVVIPERTHHPENMIEVVAPIELRKKLNLKDNDEVELRCRTKDK